MSWYDPRTTYYDAGGAQHSRRAERVFFIQRWGDFPREPLLPMRDLRAIARSAAFEQLGHFMMGTIRVGGRSITVTSGEDLDLERHFDGVWPLGACPMSGASHEAWRSGSLNSSARLSEVAREFPELGKCLRDARKRRSRGGHPWRQREV